MVRNCAPILCLLALWAVFCVVTLTVERIRSCCRRGRPVEEKATFAINGRVKVYKSNLFHIAVQGFTRILQVAFVQVLIFVLVNFSEFSGESKLSRVSKIASIVLIVVYTLFFLSYPVYRLFLQKYFTVRGVRSAKAASRAKANGAGGLRRIGSMSEARDENVLWPGLQSLYLGLTQSREGVEWYIGWFFLRRVLFALPVVYLASQQYVQVVINLTCALSSMLIVFHWRPFQYGHNMALELLNESYVFTVGMLVYCYTPFMVDPDWRFYASSMVVVAKLSIIGTNLLLMWHAIMWQVLWRMDQEEKAHEAKSHWSEDVDIAV